MKKIAIIGSGPIGAISAKYLIDNSDHKVDVIDAGLTSREFIKASKKDLIPKKTFFGNAFAYKRLDSLKFIFDKITSFDTSHALGGLSNVWGANIAGLHPKYRKKWGINKKNITLAYKYVLSNIPICARKDMIDELYDFNIASDHVIKSGLSFDHCQFDQKEKDLLLENGIAIGLSKLAIDPNKCINCGACMIGCYEDAIFNSKNIILNLTHCANFKYKSGYVVTNFEEKNELVRLEMKNVHNGRSEIFEYDYVIFASGVIDTTNIVNNSLSLGSKFTIKESKKYYLPFISASFFSSSSIDKTISLSHIFIQHLKGDSLVHCQLYPSFYLIDYVLRNKIGRFAFLLRPFKFVLKYIYIAMVYLDSEDSGDINVTFHKKNLKIDGVENYKSKKRLLAFIAEMKNNFKTTKLFPLPLILESKLGHSQHFGGTIPMKPYPKSGEVDLYGRLSGCCNTYIVDASILPSIPASPTTIVVMSNAVRICDELIKKLMSKNNAS